MSTVFRWNPFRELAAMQSMMDRMFDDTWRTVQPNFAGTMLALDVYETDKDYTVFASVPGLAPDQLNINLHEGVLNINAEIVKPEVIGESRVVLEERIFGKFSRSITLPTPVDADHVEAAYENGVLRLTLPKVPSAQPRQIPVKSGHLLKNHN